MSQESSYRVGSTIVASIGFRVQHDDVIYQPGKLRAWTRKDEKESADNTVVRVGENYGLSLEVDRATIREYGADLALMIANVVDAHGWVVTTGESSIVFAWKE